MVECSVQQLVGSFLRQHIIFCNWVKFIYFVIGKRNWVFQIHVPPKSGITVYLFVSIRGNQLTVLVLVLVMCRFSLKFLAPNTEKRTVLLRASAQCIQILQGNTINQKLDTPRCMLIVQAKTLPPVGMGLYLCIYKHFVNIYVIFKKFKIHL